jgi:hypothetical protein
MASIIQERDYIRTISDEFNPRIFITEYKCHECGQWVDSDDTVWIDPKTRKATMDGMPYHVGCAPGETDCEEDDDSDL